MIESSYRVEPNCWSLPGNKKLEIEKNAPIQNGSYGDVRFAIINKGCQNCERIVIKYIKNTTKNTKQKKIDNDDLAQEYQHQCIVFEKMYKEKLLLDGLVPQPLFLMWLGKTRSKKMVFGMQKLSKTLRQMLYEIIDSPKVNNKSNILKSMLQQALRAIFEIINFLQNKFDLFLHGDLHLANIMWHGRWYLIDWGNSILNESCLYKMGKVDKNVLPYQDIRIFASMSYKTMRLLSKKNIDVASMFKMYLNLLERRLYPRLKKNFRSFYVKPYFSGHLSVLEFEMTPKEFLVCLASDARVSKICQKFRDLLKIYQ